MTIHRVFTVFHTHTVPGATVDLYCRRNTAIPAILIGESGPRRLLGILPVVGAPHGTTILAATIGWDTLSTYLEATPPLPPDQVAPAILVIRMPPVRLGGYQYSLPSGRTLAHGVVAISDDGLVGHGWHIIATVAPGGRIKIPVSGIPPQLPCAYVVCYDGVQATIARQEE